MKSPAYHLRANKAVDRLALIDAVRHLGLSVDLSQYTYYGFGGWALEDFRLFYEFHPQVKLVSIENSGEGYKRQKFHAPCGASHLKLEFIDFRTFLTSYDSNERKSIFWIDYLDLDYRLV